MGIIPVSVTYFICFFRLCALDKQGSATVSLTGCPMNCWIKKRNGHHPIMRCILSIFVSTTFMFLLRWYLRIFLVQTTQIFSLMLTISFCLIQEKYCIYNIFLLQQIYSMQRNQESISTDPRSIAKPS